MVIDWLIGGSQISIVEVATSMFVYVIHDFISLG